MEVAAVAPADDADDFDNELGVLMSLESARDKRGMS
jgi:hypothetical protein